MELKLLISRVYSVAFLLLVSAQAQEAEPMLQRLGLPGLLRVAAIVSAGLSLLT